MSIQVGQHVPASILQYIDNGVHRIDTHTLFGGRKLVLDLTTLPPGAEPLAPAPRPQAAAPPAAPAPAPVAAPSPQTPPAPAPPRTPAPRRS